MTVSLFSFIDLYDRALATATHLLDKATDHAATRGIDEAEVLQWRLISDMKPLGFQLMVVVNFTRQWPARVAGLDVPASIADDLDAAGFRTVIADARSYLATLRADQFVGRDDVAITFALGEGMEPTLPAGQWLTVFATTNINFHLVTAYNILRARGVALDKPDIFARGL